MSESLETVIESEGSPCASGDYPMPVATLDEVAELEDAPSLAKGDLVIFNLRALVK